MPIGYHRLMLGARFDLSSNGTEAFEIECPAALLLVNLVRVPLQDTGQASGKCQGRKFSMNQLRNPETWGHVPRAGRPNHFFADLLLGMKLSWVRTTRARLQL